MTLARWFRPSRASRGLTLAAALLVAVSGATHQNANLQDLRAPDLCPPVASVYLDESEDEDFTALVQTALDRYTQASGLKWGDPGKCTIDQVLVLDAYERGGGLFVYTAELSIELQGDSVIQHAGKRYRVEAPRLWTSSYYGTYDNNLQDIANREIRDLYEGFLRAWRTTHPR